MIGDVKARIVRSDGKELTLGDGDWRIPNDGLIGWGSLDFSVSSSEIPSYDGALVTSERVPSRDRTIKAQAPKIEDISALRERVIRFFNPKFTYDVYVTYLGRTRWAHGNQLAFKVSEGNIYKPAELTWTILCANPYLQSVEDFGKDIAEVVGKFGFPWHSLLPDSPGTEEGFPPGFIVGLHTFAKEVEIINDGDVPSGMRVKIRAKDVVVNPVIRIGEGYVSLIYEMQTGDVIDLDASSRPPTVKLNGDNAMHLVDRRSSILDMMIDVGETTIEYGADDGEQNMSVSVFYNKQYLGV